MGNSRKPTLSEVTEDTKRILAEKKDKEREEMLRIKREEEKAEIHRIEEIKEQQEFLEKQTLNEIVDKNLRIVEYAKNLDETPIEHKLAETFCYPPNKTIKDMSDTEVVKFLNDLTEMISVVRTYVHTVEREMHENKLRDKKAMAEANKAYVVKNEPTVVSSQLNNVEKQLWAIAKENCDNPNDTDSIRPVYMELKKAWLGGYEGKTGMDAVKCYMDANFD